LVYGEGRFPDKVTGAHLFGNFWKNQEWANGYEALATLDSDQNGLIEGPELANIYVWNDWNHNARAELGEVRRADSLFASLSTAYEQDYPANPQDGALLLDGRKVGTWDWWSIAYRVPDRALKPDFVGEFPPVFSLYRYDDDEGRSGFPKGWFRFVRLGSQLVVLELRDYRGSTMPRIGAPMWGMFYPVEVLPDGGYTWELPGIYRVVAHLEADGSLKGYAWSPSGHEPDQHWTAVLVDHVDRDDLAALVGVGTASLGDAFGRTYDYYLTPCSASCVPFDVTNVPVDRLPEP